MLASHFPLPSHVVFTLMGHILALQLVAGKKIYIRSRHCGCSSYGTKLGIQMVFSGGSLGYSSFWDTSTPSEMSAKY